MFNPYYDNDVLILPLEGDNDSTTFTDYSASPKTVTRYGDTKISTAQSKWGNGSGRFDGTGDYLTVNSNDLAIGSGNFSVGVWARVDNLTKSFQHIIETRTSDATGFALGVQSNGNVFLFSINAFRVQAGSVTPNEWFYLELTKKFGNVIVRLNGAQIGATWASGIVNYTQTLWQFGRYYGTADYSMQGYLQDIHVTSGIAWPDSVGVPASALWRPTTIGGTVLVSGNGGADQVVVRDVATRKLAAIATPNPTTGVWTADVPESDYDISYFADSEEPVCHAPYTITA